jgi:hypothetical protein
MGDAYFHRLLSNIKFMLTYVSDNGIALPDDLRSKIAELLSHPDIAEVPEIKAHPVNLNVEGPEAGLPP